MVRSRVTEGGFEEALRLLRVTSEVVGDHLILIDRDLRILYINHTAPGLTPEDVVGQPITSFVPPEYDSVLRACFENVARTRTRDFYETAYVDNEGNNLLFDTRVSPWIENGELEGFALVSSQVTQREALQVDMHRLFHLSQDLLAIGGMDGFFRYVNPAFERALGWSIDQITSSPWLDFVHPEDKAASRAAFDGLADGEPVFDFRNRYRHRDGGYRDLVWRISLGTNDTFYGVARDDSERTSLERQLERSQKMQVVGQLAGGIAHDFNNLLTAVLVNGNLAIRQLDDAHPAKHMVREMIAAAELSAALTKQLLTFSGRRKLDTQTLDLSELAKRMVGMLRRTIPENVSIEVVHGDEPVCTRADPGQIEQVLLNLCVNARDAMPKGGHLTIETASVTLRDEAHAMLVVRDDGVGMTPQQRERIFEPFFTTKRGGHGTGLGMAVVYGIVERHGGVIQVESIMGEGTTVRVYLPADREAEFSCPPEPTTADSAGRGVILVAEDEPMVRRVLEMVLGQAGYTVLVAEDGAEACEVFEARSAEIDLVLLDVIMPRLGGPDALRRMRTRRPVKALLASGYSSAALDGSDLADVPLIDKPFRADALLAMVREILDAT